MEFDPVTFLLEIVNFVVLLWLLTRFLYRPVQSALDARAQLAARQSAELASRAADLQRGNEELARGRAELATQRAAAQARLAEEVAARRKELLASLQKEIDAERTKARARLEQDAAAAAQDAERAARQRASVFVADYLARLASPALEASIVQLFLDELAVQADAVRAVLHDPAALLAPVRIATAFEVEPALQRRLEEGLVAAAGVRLAFAWQTDAALLAGVRVETAAHRLEASLHRGLAMFIEAVEASA